MTEQADSVPINVVPSAALITAAPISAAPLITGLVMHPQIRDSVLAAHTLAELRALVELRETPVPDQA
ncbi:hypothetical protein [Rathayibacter soli]|uniref:hypothetical protein n=1 Tax=Rathayibacter soli TaxID=3144168 RepID=UPI0027E5199A|nr:hypothetical protein [Glaciibacter superstes]